MSAEETGSVPIHAKELVHACRRHAANRQWHDIVGITADRELQSIQPQLVMQRLYAALMLQDEPLIADVTERILESDMSTGVKLSAVKELALRKHPDKAARILITDPKVQKAPRFLNAARHVLKNLKDDDLLSQLRAKITTFRGGGDLIRAGKTGFTFAKQPPNEVWGTVALTASPTTPPHHADLLASDAARFKESAAAGKQPIVREFRNVFTEPSGQVWTEKGELIISRGIPMSTVKRSDVETVAIGFGANRGSRGIYHWLIDYLPRLGWIADSGVLDDDGFKILLNGGNPGFEVGSLEIVGLAGAVRKLDGPIFVERLLVAPVTFRGMVGWTHLDSVIGALGERASRIAEERGVALPKRLYITRRDADRRVLRNEAEIEALAVEQGFEVQEFSKIPLWHQIALARQASVIMAPHGAGLSHILFSAPGTKVVELLPIKDGSYALRFNYARLSIIKGHDYRAWLEEQQLLVNAWSIDLTAFKPFLASVLESA